MKGTYNATVSAFIGGEMVVGSDLLRDDESPDFSRKPVQEQIDAGCQAQALELINAKLAVDAAIDALVDCVGDGGPLTDQGLAGACFSQTMAVAEAARRRDAALQALNECNSVKIYHPTNY